MLVDFIVVDVVNVDVGEMLVDFIVVDVVNVDVG
jgi:hypothetical protein